MKYGFGTWAVGAALLVLALPARAAPVDALQILSSFGTISLGGASITSHTAAPVYVGGDLGGGFSYDGPDQGTVGDVTGTVVVGGDLSATYTGNNVTVQAGSVSGTVNGGGTVVNTGVAVPTADVTTAFLDLSAQLAGLAGTQGASFDNADQNLRGLSSGAGAGGFAVLMLDDLGFFSSGNLASYTRDPNVTFIVNIPGTTISIDGNFNQDDSNTIFNFYEATTLNVNSTFGFGVLAPQAQVNLLSGGTDTFVVGGTIDQRTEVRGTFTGDLPPPPNPVPLPAAGWLLVVALGALGAASARRRARAA